VSGEQEHEHDQEHEQERERVCPVCGAPLVAEKCKLVCRSDACVYRIVFNCSEF
jgi:hypothetical protein